MAESEADTPSTPIEFESKYFEFDGVRLPPFCRGKMEEIAAFSLRSSDIWIVTYPKSGKQPVRHRVRQRCAFGGPVCCCGGCRRTRSSMLKQSTNCSLHNKGFDGRSVAL